MLAGGLTMPVADEVPWSLEREADESLPDGPRSVFVQWGDGLGRWSDVATATIMLDTEGPSIGPPSPARLAAGTVRTDPLGIPVSVAWTAATDALSGVESYEVQVNSDGGADWESFGRPTARRSVVGTVAPGHRYQWRLRAFDQVGNASDWQAGPSATLTLIDDASSSVRYAPGWSGHRSAAAVRGTYHSSATAQATAMLAFTGRAVGIAAIVAPGSGSLDVRVDGRLVRRVALDGPGRGRRIVLVEGLRPGRHTVEVSRAQGGGVVRLDGFVTLR
jgi:hypothetical protein